MVAGAQVEVNGLTWRPARRRRPVLSELQLSIPAGQRVLLAGPSGAGKSTLLRALAGLLLTAGDGDLSGQVLLDGRAVEESRGRIGLLQQNPVDSVVAATTGRDVAFGLENQGVPRSQMWNRVRSALRATSYPYDVRHPTSALSGGETQRLALAGGLVLGADLLLLDEPTSMLDSAAAESVRAAVRREAQQRSSTLVVVEHHLEPWLDFVDRLIVIDGTGVLIADGDPRVVLESCADMLLALGVWVPGHPLPELLHVGPDLLFSRRNRPDVLVRASDVEVELASGLVDRRRERTLALRGVNAELRSGRALGVAGASGAGKSTLALVLAGLQRPTRGDVVAAVELATGSGERRPWRWSSPELATRLAWVPQLPEHGIVAATVREEVLASSRATRHTGGEVERRADHLLEAMGLASLATASPYHLSGGEQRRLMVAAALLHGPSATVLDEPTVGQDRHTWAAVLGAVASARDAGAAVMLATHDAAALAILADDLVTLERGRVA
ncbi:MAG: ATP-binding cassette domain-containing protein [Nocardioidaceae bacterium]